MPDALRECIRDSLPPEPGDYNAYIYCYLEECR